ncbi:hypothetical protein BH23CHL6_BH23CHL6_00130 [soil metagenome]
MLALACWWVSGNRIVEADVQINSNVSWATSLAGCRFQPMLGAVTTHEVGHSFGMGHVGEKKHGRLTMSSHIDGNCNNQESTLGLGDVLGLEKLYRDVTCQDLGRAPRLPADETSIRSGGLLHL